MRRILVVTAGATALVGMLAVSGTAHVRSAGVPAPAGFRLADGSAGCAFADGRVACRSATMGPAAVLEENGTTSLEDLPVEWNEATAVLRPTESWWHGDFTCRVAEGDLVCHTLEGGTIAVGDEKLIGAAPPAFLTIP